MKKFILAFVAVAFCAIAASAITPAELAGTKWKSKKIEMPSPDESVKVTSIVECIFETENTCTEKQEVTMSIFDKETRMKIDVYLKATAPETYTAEGDSITFKGNPADVKVECEDDDIRVTFPRGESNAIMESMIKSQIKPMIDMLRQEIGKSVDEPSVMKVLEMNGKKAVVEREKIQVEFSIKKI
ncbi:MAG: hypothetical protein NC102_01875 [Clostridium sp.]|nr:hypothetical protein [Clostridium sp.]